MTTNFVRSLFLKLRPFISKLQGRHYEVNMKSL